MKIITSIKEAQAIGSKIRASHKIIGFVPTMGYLHRGHLSLMKLARKKCDVLVVSIFVNPIQFGPTEDYKKYPRDLQHDSAMAQEAKVDYLFCPRAKNMYGPGYSTVVNVNRLDQIMCGKQRPGHFSGVCTVVLKLFNIIKPHQAYFGQKDYQQLAIIKRMARDLNLEIKILAGKTVREKDGLAISSRNVYLNREQRQNAAVLYKSLHLAGGLILDRQPVEKARKEGVGLLKSNRFVTAIDYFDIRDAQTLKPVLDTSLKNDILIAAAIHMGKTRLIDNIIIRGKK